MNFYEAQVEKHKQRLEILTTQFAEETDPVYIAFYNSVIENRKKILQTWQERLEAERGTNERQTEQHTEKTP